MAKGNHTIKVIAYDQAGNKAEKTCQVKVDKGSKIAAVASKTETADDKKSPEKTGLAQNYPNPMNPETWIPFSLAEKDHVTIRIYNLSGQLIRTLDL
ncbi:MAG: hypothetical protein AB1797_13420, partial [bacterium]